MTRINALLLVVLTAMTMAPVRIIAADMAIETPVQVAPVGTSLSADFLRRFAVLLMIRASFSLLSEEELKDEIVVATKQLQAGGPGPGEAGLLDRDLLAEGSYYLVSIKYLISAGGAAWPEDRADTFYNNDALVKLDALQDRLVDAVQSEADPLPIFIEAQQVLALTEGYSEVPPDLDRFAGRDELVEKALAEFGPRTST